MGQEHEPSGVFYLGSQKMFFQPRNSSGAWFIKMCLHVHSGCWQNLIPCSVLPQGAIWYFLVVSPSSISIPETPFIFYPQKIKTTAYPLSPSSNATFSLKTSLILFLKKSSLILIELIIPSTLLLETYTVSIKPFSCVTVVFKFCFSNDTWTLKQSC